MGASSSRQIVTQLDMPQPTVWKILKSKLRCHPYKITKVHAITEDDKELRHFFSTRILAMMQRDDNWVQRILWTDESHMHQNGFVNCKNCVFWVEENPHKVFPQSLHSPKVTVWCGFIGDFIIGPYFFEEQDARCQRHTVTVTGARFLQILQEFVNNKFLQNLESFKKEEY